MMEWKLHGLEKDKQSVTSDWEEYNQELIEGVKLKELKNVIKDNGHLTEIWRADWQLDDEHVKQIFQNVLEPNGLSGWHAHADTIDRIMVNFGKMKIVLYDARKDSPTYGYINEFRIGSIRPTLIVVPPKVFHAVQNISMEKSALINIVNHAYSYKDPDHWRLPIDTPEIPYTFS